MPYFCGLVHMHPDGALAKAGWAWPLSRVDVRESEVHAYAPVLFDRWTLDIPYVQIDEGGGSSKGAGCTYAAMIPGHSVLPPRRPQVTEACETTYEHGGGLT